MAAQRSQTSRFNVDFSGRNSEPAVNQPKEVFSRKHRAHCLKAMPGYWCKIAKHCKQILLPEIVKVFTRTWKESNVGGRFQSISSRSLTRGDKNGSGNIEISLGYRRRGRVLSSLGSYKTDKCSEHSPKIGPLTDLLDDMVAISLLRREVATKTNNS